jgi:hypothetical protein
MLASACASTPEHDGSGDELQGSDSDSASRDGGKSAARDAGKDSGKSTSGGSTSTGSGSSSGTKTDGATGSGSKVDAGKTSGGDGGITLPDLAELGDLGGLLGGASDGGAAKPSGDGGMCENLVCFDIFDCAIFHPDALDCGFTKCEGFVCKK